MSTSNGRNPAMAVSLTAPDTDDIRGIEIPRPSMIEATLSLEGITPLIMHNWSEKAAKMIEDKVTGKARTQRGARDPEEEVREAAYTIPGREDMPDWSEGKYYFPAPAFKHAFLYGVSLVADVKNMPKSKATSWVFIDTPYPVLRFESVTSRMDIGRNPTQPVYRPQFNGWTIDIDISFNALAITPEQIVSLFDLGGTGGIGEWRPTAPKNKSGDWGRFRVVGITERR